MDRAAKRIRVSSWETLKEQVKSLSAQRIVRELCECLPLRFIYVSTRRKSACSSTRPLYWTFCAFRIFSLLDLRPHQLKRRKFSVDQRNVRAKLRKLREIHQRQNSLRMSTLNLLSLSYGDRNVDCLHVRGKVQITPTQNRKNEKVLMFPKKEL